MDRIGFVAVFFIIFVIADVSDASSSLSKHRILIGEPQKDNTTVPGKVKGKADSPVPSPLLPPTLSSAVENGSETKPVDDPSKDKVESPPPMKTPTVDQGPKGGLNDDTNKGPEKSKDNVTHSADEGGKKKSKEKEKEKNNDDVTQLPNEDKESCNGVINRCEVKDVAVACIKSFDSGSKEVAILVQNVQDSTLNAKLSADDASKDIEIPKNQHEKVNISIGMGKSTKITLNAGNGECELHTDPLPLASEGNLFMRFPSLSTVATPINGAYFLIVTVLILGGIWVCCLVRKRKERTGGGVPYQELEMGLPESVPATAMETAEGWDEGWDDDWDGDNAVKSPGAHLGSISANGLTSRTANKDGWDDQLV